MTTPIFGVGLDRSDLVSEIYGQIPAAFNRVLKGLCEGLGVKYDSVVTDSPCDIVRFLIGDLDPTSELAIRGFLSGLDAEEYDAPEVFGLMAGSVCIKVA